MATGAPRDEQGRELCARCWRVRTSSREQWEHVDGSFICPGCCTYEETRMLNTRRRLQGLEERPVGPLPPSFL
jgi:hypothetical protein